MPDGATYLSTGGCMRVLVGTENGQFKRLVERIERRSLGFSSGPEFEFHPPDNNTVVCGYSTDVLVALAGQSVALYFADQLHPSQTDTARRAGALLAACAANDLRRAVWAATGYVDLRRELTPDEKVAFALRLEAGPWQRLFSREFFLTLARLFRLELGSDGRRPLCFAAFLREFFYEWFDEEVYAELKRRNPRPTKGSNHHQLLSPEARASFERHHRDVLLLMRASESLSDFRMRFNAALRGQGLQMMLLTG
jgi:hypothetical protein